MSIRETIIQEAREKLKILLIENSEKTDQKKSLNNYMKKFLKFSLIGGSAAAAVELPAAASGHEIKNHPELLGGGILLGAGLAGLFGAGLPPMFKKTKK